METLLYTIAAIMGGVCLHWAARIVRGIITKQAVPTPSVQGQMILLGIGALVTAGFSALGFSIFTTGRVDIDEWETTEGTVTVLDVVTEEANRGFSFSGNVQEDLYYVRLEYTYIADGVERVGFQRIPNEQLFDGQYVQLEPDELETFEADYTVGSVVTVYYNPDNPDEAALTSDNDVPYIVLGGVVGGVMGLLAGIFALPIGLFVLSGAPAEPQPPTIDAHAT